MPLPYRFSRPSQFVGLTSNRIQIISDSPLDEDPVNENELTNAVTHICSKATNNETVDLSNAIFYRVYDRKTHAIEMLPVLSCEKLNVIDPVTDEQYTAYEIPGTEYFVAVDKNGKYTLKHNLMRFEDKYSSLFFKKLDMCVKTSQVVRFAYKDKVYIFKQTSISEMLPDIEVCNANYTAVDIYDIITGASLNSIVETIIHSFCDKTKDYLLSHHKEISNHSDDFRFHRDLDDKIEEWSDKYREKIIKKIKDKSTYLDADDECVTKLAGRDIPLLQLYRELNDIDDKISVNIGIAMSTDNEYRNYRNDMVFTPTIRITAYYDKETALCIEAAMDRYHSGNIHSAISHCPYPQANMRITPLHDKFKNAKSPISRETSKSLGFTVSDRDYDITLRCYDGEHMTSIIKNVILAVKTKMNKNAKNLSFNGISIAWTYARLGNIPGVIKMTCDDFEFVTPDFELSCRLCRSMSAVVLICSLFSNMTKTQLKDYVTQTIDSIFYSIRSDTYEHIIDDMKILIEKKSDRDKTYYPTFSPSIGPDVQYKNEHLLIPYGCRGASEYIGFDPRGKIPKARTIYDAKAVSCHTLTKDLSEETPRIKMLDLLISTFNELDIKRTRIYPFMFSSNMSEPLGSVIKYNEHEDLYGNLKDALETFDATRATIGGCQRISIETECVGDCTTKTIELADENSARYMLTITTQPTERYKKISIAMSRSKYDGYSNRQTDQITFEINDINDDMSEEKLDVIVASMRISLLLFPPYRSGT